MGYDLTSLETKEDFRFTSMYWPRLLKLASEHGWEDQGTNPPEDLEEDEEWDGNYWHNSGQIVTKDDAANLATALEAAIPNLPAEEVTLPKPPWIDKNTTKEEWEAIPPAHFFSGEKGIQSIKEFIEFCKKGGFLIR